MSIYLFRVRACVQNEQKLRNAISDVSNEINKYKKELESSNVLAKIDESEASRMRMLWAEGGVHRRLYQ